MIVKQIKFKRGSTTALNNYTGEAGEIVVNTTTNRIHVMDGATKGGTPQALTVDNPTSLSKLTNDSLITKSQLNKVGQLTDDIGHWNKTTLTKISQLQNDSGFINSYCTHCMYCTNCS